MSFKDHFSGHADTYARFRPRYPDALYAWLAQQCARREHAWDCATGNGQAAVALAGHFEHVSATDASAAQIDRARPAPRVTFSVATAEQSGLAPRSVDLITVAQALHWFDLPRFFTHAREVLRQDGCLAVWTYTLFSVDSPIDTLIDRFYRQTLDGWWPPERAIVERGYRDILPDWPRINAPAFDMQQHWGPEDVLGYLSSWSAVQRYRRACGRDPLAQIAAALRERWGPAPRSVRWPLILHVLRHPDAG